jgi:hypothetical protein
MALFRVEWVIDLDAESPREAAEKARAIQQDPKSIAHVYHVRQHTPGSTLCDRVDVDLDEKEKV